MSANSHNGEFKLIVVSSPDGFDHELRDVKEMFEAGLEYFHVRKPKFSTSRLRRYLSKIDKKYHNRIVLHTHHELSVTFKVRGIHLTRRHLSKKVFWSWLQKMYMKLRRPNIETTVGFHTLTDLKENNPGYSYVFLSPVFDSISKVGYKSTFNEESLREILSETSFKVIAMGGVDESKIMQAKEWGFSGVAVLGSIWKAKDPVEKFNQIKQLCKQIQNM